MASLSQTKIINYIPAVTRMNYSTSTLDDVFRVGCLVLPKNIIKVIITDRVTNKNDHSKYLDDMVGFPPPG